MVFELGFFVFKIPNLSQSMYVLMHKYIPFTLSARISSADVVGIGDDGIRTTENRCTSPHNGFWPLDQNWVYLSSARAPRPTTGIHIPSRQTMRTSVS